MFLLMSPFYKNFPLKERTTIKIGGVAEIFFVPRSVEELKKHLPQLVRNYPHYFLGGGSNTIFGNFKGVVISSELLKGYKVLSETPEGVLLEVFSGTPLRELMKFSIEGNFCGLETLFGIPRITIGGAVAMNAGAYGREISQTVKGVYYVEPSTGEEILEENPLFGYRSSPFPSKGFITKVLLHLERCKCDLRGKIRELNLKRRKSQPLEFPTSGSTFKNPSGDYAGKLLQAVGLKGFCTKRGLCFSKKHANFLVNVEKKATLEDTLELINLAKERVWKEFGIRLEEEVKIVSTDG